ncbi:MAG TPA: NAD(P)(+) transhydrogenase (Re/Si-specific) subunit beta [Myxococcota bacterium]|nr:NAD(P)(+) transhydrogenase (Re/Si-specific) subunit beta [Myxococcota bacterium]
MDNWTQILIDLAIIVLLVIGISMFRTPRGARRGNAAAALALLLAMAIVLYRNAVMEPAILIIAMVVGGAIGTLVAVRVTMIQIPAMVAFQHGAGGIAACAIAFVELTRGDSPTIVGEVSGLLGLVIGAATFSGSMVASAKLAGKLKGTPTVLPGHGVILLTLLTAIAGLGVLGAMTRGPSLPFVLVGVLVAAVLLGLFFSIRIGGADMPVLISFLNATAGLAAAFCGVIIQNRLLIACGATVAASGSILTAVMCRAMNRSFVKVLAGGKMGRAPSAGVKPPAKAPVRVETIQAGPMERAKQVLREARSVIIIPGYGMALARAQFKVATLAKRMEELGKTVTFAIHPVAGRMPGHMNVLLAEADVDYDKLKEMDDVNSSFAATDAVLVVGACDVVNPAAIRVADTPISGMPILNAHEAKNVLVCNLDERPGYSGVPNPLYDEAATLLLFGDANATVAELLVGLSGASATAPAEAQVEATPAGAMERAKKVLREARSVIVIPGYGMALARAQFKVASLAKRLEELGKTVTFAIHPVAGRMPGHMNVLLAEADVDYDKLKEMDDVNSSFAATDAVLVVGACDVVNPAAIRVADTPISGMPILNAHEAKNVLVCNLDERPGYSGVPNPLYDEATTLLLFGDANATVTELLESLSEEQVSAPRTAGEPSHPRAGVAARLTTDALSERLLRAEYAVRGPIVQRAQELEAQGQKIIYCNIGNPQALKQKPLTYLRQLLSLLEVPALLDEPAVTARIPKDIVARARTVLEKHPHGTGAYSQSPGIPFIRQAVAEFITRRDGIPADPASIILTDGASKGVQAVLTAFVKTPQDGFMIPIPQYPLYSASLTLLGGQRIGYHLDEENHWQLREAILTQSLEDAEKAGIHPVGLVVINPGNPTGAVLSRENIEMVIGFARRHGLVLISDEVYQENVYAEGCAFHSFAKVMHAMGDEETPLFSLHSVSKGFLGECGHRGGYLEMRNIPPAIHRELIKLQSIALCANIPGQLATYAMVAPPGPGDESHAEYVRERDGILGELKKKAEILGQGINRIPGMSVEQPQGAMYAFVRFELPSDPFIDLRSMSAEERAGYAARQESQYCLTLLEETGICVVPGSGFGQQPGTLHFRTTFLPPRSEIQALVARLGEFHRRYTRRNQSSAA